MDQLKLRVDTGAEADAEELDRLTRQLLRELTELNVGSAQLAAGVPAPPGTRAATADTELGCLDATAVPADFVNRHMSWSRSHRIVLLLDAEDTEVLVTGDFFLRTDTRCTTRVAEA